MMFGYPRAVEAGVVDDAAELEHLVVDFAHPTVVVRSLLTGKQASPELHTLLNSGGPS